VLVIRPARERHTDAKTRSQAAKAKMNYRVEIVAYAERLQRPVLATKHN
jgi:hypothetical protein